MGFKSFHLKNWFGDLGVYCMASEGHASLRVDLSFTVTNVLGHPLLLFKENATVSGFNQI